MSYVFKPGDFDLLKAIATSLKDGYALSLDGERCYIESLVGKVVSIAITDLTPASFADYREGGFYMTAETSSGETITAFDADRAVKLLSDERCESVDVTVGDQTFQFEEDDVYLIDNELYRVEDAADTAHELVSELAEGRACEIKKLGNVNETSPVVKL